MWLGAVNGLSEWRSDSGLVGHRNGAFCSIVGVVVAVNRAESILSAVAVFGKRQRRHRRRHGPSIKRTGHSQ